MRPSQEIQWKQLFRLQADPSLPLQVKLRAAIVQAILEDRLPPGAAMPSSRELAELLGMSRNTVTAAYTQLNEEGFLIARPRSGVYVSSDVKSVAVPRSSTTADVRAAATPPHWNRRVRRSLSGVPTLSKPDNWRKFEFPFVYGRHDAQLFPTEDFRECCVRTLARSQLPQWTPDFDTDDVPDLVEQVRLRLLPRRGVFALKEEILVTVGAQQAYYLLAEALLDEGASLGLEEPGHPHARNTFGLRRPRLHGLPVDVQGLIVEDLPALDYVFVTPSHQSPTTATMSLPRREALLRHAEERDMVIIEDDYEAENLYEGTPMPALKSLDRSGRVVYIGSVSKSLSPALRIGYIVAPQPLINELRLLRHAMVRHPSAFLQQAYALFLSLGHHESHLRRVNQAMQERLEVLAASMSKHLREFRFTIPQGGASVWVQAPAWVDAAELALLAQRRGVLIEAGSVFFARPPYPCPFFRLRLSSIATERVEPGIEALSKACDELAELRGEHRHSHA